MNILNKFTEIIINLDEKIKKILHKGIQISFFLTLFSSVLLFTYQYFYEQPRLYYIGISLLKSSLMFICSFIMCAIGFDTIKKQIA